MSIDFIIDLNKYMREILKKRKVDLRYEQNKRFIT